LLHKSLTDIVIVHIYTTFMSYEEEDTFMSYEEEDTFMSYEEEDTFMSYEEEDTFMSYDTRDLPSVSCPMQRPSQPPGRQIQVGAVPEQ